MSREIKFRAWDGELEFFTDTCGYFIELDGSAWFNLGASAGEGDCLVDQSSKLIVEQFTGLFDKNGKEIYEGDIVVYRDTSGSGRPRDFGPRKIRWYRDSCNFNVSRPGNGAEVEVIGNIHQNPELLK